MYKETIRYFIIYYNDMGDYDYISVLSLDHIKTITSLNLWSGLRPFLMRVHRNRGSALSSYSLPILVVRCWIGTDLRAVVNQCKTIDAARFSKFSNKDEIRNRILEFLDPMYQNSKEYKRWIV